MPAVSTSSSPASPSTALGFPAVARLLASLLPGTGGGMPEGESMLELSSPNTQPARLISASIVEGHELRARRVFDPPTVGFAAFLDGAQESRVARYLDGGVPVIFGTVAAVIRDRRNQRMFTWAHRVERRLYASRTHVSATVWRQLESSGIAIVDTADDAEDAGEHPLALRERAVHSVQRDREALEQILAGEWCRREERPILIDGGISGAEPMARSQCAVGVIKSHRTLYARGDALAAVLALQPAERSSVFLVTSPKRATVASWYLRIRDSRGHDPMWGLVRVEVAPEERDIAARADLVSRWILAETSPVSLPDARWDKMVYGIRDCEEFLRAIR